MGTWRPTYGPHGLDRGICISVVFVSLAAASMALLDWANQLELTSRGYWYH